MMEIKIDSKTNIHYSHRNLGPALSCIKISIEALSLAVITLLTEFL